VEPAFGGSRRAKGAFIVQERCFLLFWTDVSSFFATREAAEAIVATFIKHDNDIKQFEQNEKISYYD
jgi:hypothetical protein